MPLSDQNGVKPGGWSCFLLTVKNMESLPIARNMLAVFYNCVVGKHSQSFCNLWLYKVITM